MTVSYSHGREFVEQARPYLEASDPRGLVRFLACYWPDHPLRELLTCGHDDAVKIAAVCLGLTGTMEDNRLLAPLLHAPDPVTPAVVEYAMWSIWFRFDDAAAARRLCQAVRLIGENKFDAALDCLNHLIERHPRFAEAYNQRAIVYFLKECYVESLSDCMCTLRLNPFHFGALAGTGHCHTCLGQLDAALDAYVRALQLHPRMEGIRQSVHQLRCTLATRQAGSPAPIQSRAARRSP